MNFEKGKWYRTLLGSYVKYFDTTSEGIFRSSEDIMYDSRKHCISYSHWGYYKAKGNFIEIDVSEIQQYLPDNHPDKLSNKIFILPKNWYVIVTKENQDTIVKWADKDDIPIGNICGMCLTHDTNRITIEHNPRDTVKANNYDFGQEISFEQFKKYVLKEESSKDDYSYLIKLLKNITK
jgi:hypothetical protein